MAGGDTGKDKPKGKTKGKSGTKGKAGTELIGPAPLPEGLSVG